MIECRDAGRLRSAFLALELDHTMEAEVRSHVAACDRCRAELAEADAAVAFALRLPELDVREDESFVSGVLAGIHQRRIEGRVVHRRRGILAAAAGLLLAVLGGWALLRDREAVSPAAVAEHLRQAPAAVEPAFVEVEGEGVRLYQLDTAPPEAGRPDGVRVAFIVDPQLEL